jgi:transposase
LQLADLEENAVQAGTAAQMAKSGKIGVAHSSAASRRAGRRRRICHGNGLSIRCRRPAHVVAKAATQDRRIRNEMLELIPRQWKVIQQVRKKFVSQAFEAITQPVHSLPR